MTDRNMELISSHDKMRISSIWSQFAMSSWEFQPDNFVIKMLSQVFKKTDYSQLLSQ